MGRPNCWDYNNKNNNRAQELLSDRESGPTPVPLSVTGRLATIVSIQLKYNACSINYNNNTVLFY